MKNLFLFILISSLCFAGPIRKSESGSEPEKLRHLQGGILVAWDIQKVHIEDDAGSRDMYKYQEILLHPGSIIPDDVPLKDDEWELLLGYNSIQTKTYWQNKTIGIWLSLHGVSLSETGEMTKDELQSVVKSIIQ